MEQIKLQAKLAKHIGNKLWHSEISTTQWKQAAMQWDFKNKTNQAATQHKSQKKNRRQDILDSDCIEITDTD